MNTLLEKMNDKETNNAILLKKKIVRLLVMKSSPQ